MKASPDVLLIKIELKSASPGFIENTTVNPGVFVPAVNK